MTDPIPALRELAGAAEEIAVLLEHFPEPGSAPSSAISRVLRRLKAAEAAHDGVRREVVRRLLGRTVG